MQLIKKLGIIFTLIISLLLPLNSVHAASFGVSASNNGKGKAIVSISGNVVGNFSIQAGNAYTTAYIDNIGDGATVELTTGAGTFTVVVTALNASDSSYNLLDGQ